MLYFHLTESTEECWADESTSIWIRYFLIDVTKLHARLQAQGDRWARKVNYFSFSYPYVYFKCSSLSVPEGGQLIFQAFVSTQKHGCGVSGCSWQRCEEFCSEEEYQKEQKTILLSEAFLRVCLKLKCVVILAWKFFHQEDCGLCLKRTMVSTFLQNGVISFPASCIQKEGFQMEPQPQGAESPPWVHCRYFSAVKWFASLWFCHCKLWLSLAVWNRWWSSACSFTIYLYSSMKTG